MAYARQIDFEAGTTIPAGNGALTAFGDRQGINDEIAAAWLEATGLAPAHFPAGAINTAHEAAPRHAFTVSLGGDPTFGPTTFGNTNYAGTGAANKSRAWRTIGSFRGRVPFRLAGIDLFLSGYNFGAIVASPSIQIRKNAPDGGLICQSIRLLDFRLNGSRDQLRATAEYVQPFPDADDTNYTANNAQGWIGHADARLKREASGNRHVVRIGFEDSQIPLLLTDFAAGDIVFVSVRFGRNAFDTFVWTAAELEGLSATLHIEQDEF